ncbi:MAG: acetyl-CoA carboxylase biotin carboxyl carrier protein [Bdellovibrionota bacterium]|nr:acetyl-CoA carboxylase biotin carboxyl carrier protein [Bdellovibrionota bacterium]
MSDFDKLKDFIELAKQEGVSELKYEDDGKKFFVSFNAAPAVISHVAPTATPTVAVDTVSAGSTATDNHHQITSPFVGTFYASPSPDKPAFVKVGDRVSKGQTLCILEAMKIMNEIESDVDGEIVEICSSNESLVEYGQTLFKIRA